MALMNSEILEATLDTNVLVEFWKDRDKAATTKTLLDLAQSGLLDLAVTSRIGNDIPHSPMADRLDELPEIGVKEIGSPFRLGMSALGGGDMLGSGEFLDVVGQIEDMFNRHGRVKNRPDWDHIHGHYLKGRDVFLTWDRPLVDAAPELKAQLGIVVMKPEDFLSCFS